MEVSLCPKVKFSNPHIFATCWCKPSLKYQRSTILGCKYIGIRKFEFVSETQLLC